MTNKEKKHIKKDKAKATEEQIVLDEQEKFKECIEEYEKKVEKLEKDSEELKDSALRAIAEVENVRKRKDKEMTDVRKYALSDFIKELVPIIENLYRSTDHITEEQRQDENVVKIVEGIEITQTAFVNLLKKKGVERIIPKIGDVFDHNYHEALSMVEDKTKPNNSIIQVIEAGYVMNDRLLKPSLVIVSKK